MGNKQLDKGQLSAVVALRILLGWYIFYQGLVKYYDPSWTSKGFLENSWGPFSGMFQSMAESNGLVSVLDFLNLYGQLAVGLGLMLGALSTVAAVAGMVMIGMYYLAAPPFSRLGYGGTALVVDTTLLLVVALFVVSRFPTSRRIGLDRLVFGPPSGS